jgi:hypothetical protein
MNTQVAYAFVLAFLTFAILVRAFWLKVETGDIPCTYKLFAVRDALIRLVVEGKIRRDDPYFDAMYRNVTIMLRSSRLISGPAGWPLAAYSGRIFARQPNKGAKLVQLPSGELPKPLVPVTDELHCALSHLVDNHFGVFLQVDMNRREAIKIRKEQARQFLSLLPNSGLLAGAA